MQRVFSYRQGDRSEYLAQYILSSFAISVPVPRQEDVGTDFHCSLLRVVEAPSESKGTGKGATTKYLRPYLPFDIQIKSADEKKISFGGFTDGGNWRKHEIEQLRETSTPLLIGLVHKEKFQLDLFTTIPRYFVHYLWKRKGLPQRVDLIPYSPEGEGHLTDGEDEKPKKAKKKKKGKDVPDYVWKLPIGQPIIRISAADAENPAKVEEIKNLLEPYLYMDHENGVLARTGVGYFKWPLIIRTGKPLKEVAFGWAPQALHSNPGKAQMALVARAAASILAMHEQSGAKAQILAWESVLGQLPLAELPAQMREKIKTIIASAKG